MLTFRHLVIPLVGFLLLSSESNTHGAPVRLTETEFTSVFSTATNQQTETFEGFATGNHASPFTFLNGRMTSPPTSTPRIITGFGGNSLAADGSIGDPRVLNAFPSGTDLVGMNLFTFGTSNTYDITVIGGSGTLTLTNQSVADISNFIGFRDASGIVSITVDETDGSVSNYAFDNLQTAAVPEPSALFLLVATALVPVGFRRRRT